VDTPGFSSFELSEIEPKELQNYYPEFRDYIGKCRFAGCSHISEPGCMVKSALENGMINKDRYGRYIIFYNMLRTSSDVSILRSLDIKLIYKSQNFFID